MGAYRVGYLFGSQASGSGVGFSDYAYPQTDTTVAQLDAWLETHTRPGHLGEHGQFWWEDAWIDSTEEPCLLHLH